MDIYFDKRYAMINSELEKNSTVESFSYRSKNGNVEYIFLKRPICYRENRYFDIITPYGYGGPRFFDIVEGKTKELVADFYKEFSKYCLEEKIISEFIRFHPLERNCLDFENEMDIVHISDTIYIDLLDNESIFSTCDLKCRNKIRKALKNDVFVVEDKDMITLDTFYSLYKNTMDKNQANNFYYFDYNYFEKLKKELGDSITIFNAKKNDEIIATTLILKGDKNIHYHLSANTSEGYKTSANNLLLFEIAKWGHKNKFEKFHLGGGYGGNESSLFKFKESFNKNGNLKFVIGKKIHNYQIYDELVKEKENPKLIGEKNDYFPLYRR